MGGCTIPIPAALLPWLPPCPCVLTERVPYLEHGALVLVGVEVGHELRTVGVQPDGHIGLIHPHTQGETKDGPEGQTQQRKREAQQTPTEKTAPNSEGWETKVCTEEAKKMRTSCASL